MRTREALFSWVVVVVVLLTTGTTTTEAYLAIGRWEGATAVYYVNPRNNDVSEAAAIAAVRYAAEAWSTQSQASFAFVYGGTTTGTTVAGDGTSIVIFRESDSGALAATYYWGNNRGYIFDADIVFYDRVTFFTGSSGCSGGWYVEDVGTHEFGHALGLGHSAVGGSTMASGQGQCTTYQRTLAADDIAGIEYLYPSATTTSTPPRPPTGVKMISQASTLGETLVVGLELYVRPGHGLAELDESLLFWTTKGLGRGVVSRQVSGRGSLLI